MKRVKQVKRVKQAEAASNERYLRGAQFNSPDQMSVSLKRLGRDENPLLVIDNALANPEEVRALALASDYRPPLLSKGYYPGYTSPCSIRGVSSIARWVARYIWKNAYGLDDDNRYSHLDRLVCDSFFSIFAPAKNTKYMNVHVDGHSWLAMLIYLTPGEEKRSGTGFWKHKPTKLQSVYNGSEPTTSTFRIDALFGTNLLGTARDSIVTTGKTYKDWVATLMPHETQAPFPNETHGDWQKIGAVPAKFNRLVVYPTWQFHSITTSQVEPPASIHDARLTLNTFIKHPLVDSLEQIAAAPIPDLARSEI